MPHINTSPGEYDRTVSAYIFRTDGDEPTLLLHRHRIFQRYLQFGGHIERKENPWEAIWHEVPEESGFAMEQLQILQPRHRIRSMGSSLLHPIPATYFSHPFQDIPHHHTDTGWLFVTNQEPAGQPDERESKDIRQFTLADAEASDEIMEGVVDVFRFAVEHALSNWEALPTSAFKLQQ